jgi:beta-1,4-mannosyltransferase
MAGTLSQQSDIVSHVISICHRQRLNTSLMRDLLTGPTLPQLIYVAVFCFISSLLLLLKRSSRSKPSPRSVAILVLGDVGRSPRMMYHAESFAKLHFETFLVGYQGNVSLAAAAFLRTPRLGSPFSLASLLLTGSQPIPSLLSLPHVHFLYISQPPPSLRKLPFIVFAPLKIAQQVLSILYALLWRTPRPPEFILVQVSLLTIPAPR